MKNIILVLVCFVMSIDIAVADSNNRFSVKDVRGVYTFSFQGDVIGVGAVAAAGLAEADGKGNIVGSRTISVAGFPISNDTYTCTYDVNDDGSGSAICPLDNPQPGFAAIETFDFVLESGGKAFRYLGTTPGVTVLGSGQKR